ncbi:hypothetical protein [Mycobacterium shigaense]|uniref:hypothetical protein n=1 Tax=Mycobacterium shigaense TaxID=722731 RepID=UPI000BBAE41F|nr:hypothetical protein [Mycobacterium shigaense]PRI12910.1 hypothetical protein B2J96_22750 [Mycobacterium shigaense]
MTGARRFPTGPVRQTRERAFDAAGNGNPDTFTALPTTTESAIRESGFRRSPGVSAYAFDRPVERDFTEPHYEKH